MRVHILLTIALLPLGFLITSCKGDKNRHERELELMRQKSYDDSVSNVLALELIAIERDSRIQNQQNAVRKVEAERTPPREIDKIKKQSHESSDESGITRWTTEDKAKCKKSFLSLGHLNEMEEEQGVSLVNCICDKLEGEFISWDYLENTSSPTDIDKIQKLSYLCIHKFVMTGWSTEDKAKCKAACKEIRMEYDEEDILDNFEECMCKKLETQFYSWDIILKRMNENDERVMSQISKITQECIN